MSAHPEDPTNERPRERTLNPVEENAMTSSQNTSGNEPEREFTDPTAAPLSDPTSGSTAGTTGATTGGTGAGPDATTEIPSASTQALPAQAPFRVEPARPVPDDAVRVGSELPHLPPPAGPPSATPSGPSAAPSWSAPESAPRPALVTVNKGPRPATVMLGLLTVLVAAYLLLANLTHVDLGFSFTGPAVLGAFGGMLLLVGIAGVVAGRLRR